MPAVLTVSPIRIRCCESSPIRCVYADCSRVSGSTLGSSEAAKLCSTLPASLKTRALNDEYSGVSLFALTATVSGSTDDGAATHALSATGNSSCRRVREENVMPRKCQIFSCVQFMQSVHALLSSRPCRKSGDVGYNRQARSRDSHERWPIHLPASTTPAQTSSEHAPVVICRRTRSVRRAKKCKVNMFTSASASSTTFARKAGFATYELARGMSNPTPVTTAMTNAAHVHGTTWSVITVTE